MTKPKNPFTIHGPSGTPMAGAFRFEDALEMAPEYAKWEAEATLLDAIAHAFRNGRAQPVRALARFIIRDAQGKQVGQVEGIATCDEELAIETKTVTL